MISVIIPAFNEEKRIERCLLSIRRQRENTEIIVVDGASQDGTVDVARRHGAEIITLEKPNLAKQLNMGAAAARGDIFLFLHADSELTCGSLTRLSNLQEGIVGGSFTLLVKGPRFFYKILSVGGNLYCRLTGTYFGDRGIFVRQDIFLKLNGYRDMLIMTDVDFSRRLNALGRTKIVKGPILTSSRKFDKETPFRTIYLILWSLWAFRKGVDPEKIKAKYYGQ
jgi:rSAM/selenodomain-associated transferase 2